ARRGKLFSKLIREIMVAAREGGGDPDMNPRLRQVIAKAKAANVPAENIERAIKKGTGELEGEKYEESVYEGYGPGGVAILIYALTDNKKRTTAELKHILSKSGGSMGEAGCVSWMFKKKGVFSFERASVDEDKLVDVATEAGAEDIEDDGSYIMVYTEPSDFESMKEALDQAGLVPVTAEISMIPSTTVKLEGQKAEQMLRLMETLEDHDDVQQVYANFDISEEEMERLS
ncbi:MAG TPA: YebC/PmpR family DNA-binding transcriptional regulator, partial [Proteobacteria bacterium]|nr:YebC/PmpR family DNA-binding transcriptional regulator [Pseudomonadota bacterium]